MCESNGIQDWAKAWDLHSSEQQVKQTWENAVNTHIVSFMQPDLNHINYVRSQTDKFKTF